MNSPDTIADTSALESCLGKPPAGVNMKVIDHFDDHAMHWLSCSPLAFIGFGGRECIDITLGGGEPGFARAHTKRYLRVPVWSLDEPQQAVVGASVGALFLVPGVGETLRVNGEVPTLVTGIESPEPYLRESAGLARARPVVCRHASPARRQRCLA